MNGAQLIIKILQNQAVKIIFGYPGGAIMPVYDVLFKNITLRHILCRHEQGAIFSSIGYARATGKVGVCIVTSGPGATNIITGLADALMDSIPIVAITGQVSIDSIGTDSFQEIDMIGLSLSCTKHSFLVKSVNELPDVINTAFDLARSGRPGPVLIDIPKDIQMQEYRGNITCTKKVYIVNIKNIINKNNNMYKNIIKARQLMQNSYRIILYIGGGVGIANAVSELRKFISITRIPSVVTLKGLGSVKYNDIYYLGMLGMHGNKAANIAIQFCDLLIIVGARCDDRAIGSFSNLVLCMKKIIHIDIDWSEFNKLYKANIIIQGNLKDILLKLAQPLSINNWRNKIQKLKNKYQWQYNTIQKKSINVPFLLKKVNDLAPSNIIITTDVGKHQMWVAQHMYFELPNNFITSSGLGSMGFGLPAAIGAKLGCPDNTVLCISGDGSFIMNIQELTTIKRNSLSIKIILIDNKCLGMVYQWQKIFFNKRYSETILKDNPDFLMLAKAFGISGLHIKNTNEITDGIQELFSTKDSFLLHVSVSIYQDVLPFIYPSKINKNKYK